MASADAGIIRQIGRIFGGASSAGLEDRQLLDRFVRKRDEAAFEALVQRHGRMVLGVCRRLLDSEADAEDAFQATFLVLVRRAASIRDADRLGNWLYGVAHRVAARLRSDAIRRRERERRGAEMNPRGDSSHEPFLDGLDFDLGPALHVELNRLPEKYRAPVVLCDLEGRSHEEAARLLRWPVGSVKGRLSRARDLLRGRLSRKGITLAAGGVATCLARDAKAALPPTLVDSTVQAAMQLAAGQTIAAGLASAAAVGLAERVVQSMILSPTKLAAAGLTVAFLIGTAGAAAYQAGERPLSGLLLAAGLQEPAAKAELAPQEGSSENPAAGSTEKAVAPAPDPEQPNDRETAPAELHPDPLGPYPSTDAAGSDLLNAARKFVRVAEAAYASGNWTIDRYIDASRQLCRIQCELTDDPEIQRQARFAHLARLYEELNREKAKQEIGASARPNLAAAQLAVAEAEYALKHPTNNPGDDTPVRSLEGGALDDGPELSGAIDDEPQNQLILRALEMPLDMSFSGETPLRDVLQFIRSATESEALPNGIPIYVDPVSLQQQETTMDSPVTMELTDVKLKTTLRLLLHQLELGYIVKEGLLMIGSFAALSEESGANETQPVRVGIGGAREPDKNAAPSQLKGTGGGFIGGGALDDAPAEGATGTGNNPQGGGFGGFGGAGSPGQGFR